VFFVHFVPDLPSQATRRLLADAFENGTSKAFKCGSNAGRILAE
jgi:hypothetical protein